MYSGTLSEGLCVNMLQGDGIPWNYSIAIYCIEDRGSKQEDGIGIYRL